MKKVIILTMAISLIVAGIAMATVISSKHDLRPSLRGVADMAGIKAGSYAGNQVCVFCHHPHRGSSAIGQTNLLLWNVSQVTTVGNWTTYTSSTIDSVGTGDAMGSVDKQTTLACLSCHSGDVAIGSVIKSPIDGDVTASGASMPTRAQLGNATFEDDHPVDFTYPSSGTAGDIRAAVNELIIGVGTSGTYPLDSGIMRCTTCHSVHDAGPAPGRIQFLRGSMDESQLCRDCHTSK